MINILTEDEFKNAMSIDDPFHVRNVYFKKSVNKKICNVNYHNYGVRKYGFCANCNDTELKKI